MFDFEGVQPAAGGINSSRRSGANKRVAAAASWRRDGEDGSSLSLELFVLSSPDDGNLTADGLLLNGVAVAMDAASPLVAQPRTLAVGEPLLLPPFSYGFLVFPAVHLAACVPD